MNDLNEASFDHKNEKQHHNPYDMIYCWFRVICTNKQKGRCSQVAMSDLRIRNFDLIGSICILIKHRTIISLRGCIISNKRITRKRDVIRFV